MKQLATVLILTGMLAVVATPAKAQDSQYAQVGAYPSAATSAQPAAQNAYPSTSDNLSYSTASAYPDTGAQQSAYTPAGYPSAASPVADRYAYWDQTERSPSDQPSRSIPQLGTSGPGKQSVVEQMLNESPSHGVPSAYPATGSCGIDFTCGDELGCGTTWTPSWYASAAWLTIGRDKPNRLWTTYEDGNNANQLSTRTDIDWGNGGEITVGRTYCCDRWRMEATYWQLSPMEGDVSVTHANNVSTTLDFADVVYADPALAGLLPVSLFDGAAEHRVWRRDKIHNIEINMIRNRNCGVDACRKRLDIDWSLGVRYLHFEEDWAFRSLQFGGSWSNPAEVGCLDDEISNNLVGFQFGFDVNYQLRPTIRLFVQPKFGIYNNHISNTFRAYRGDGEDFAPDAVSGVVGTYPVHSSTDTLSFLTEIDLGVDWHFRPRWSAQLGYRVIVATGIGLADNQIPPYIVDIPEIASIDDNGELVLHGAFAGLTFNY